MALEINGLTPNTAATTTTTKVESTVNKKVQTEEKTAEQASGKEKKYASHA